MVLERKTVGIKNKEKKRNRFSIEFWLFNQKPVPLII